MSLTIGYDVCYGFFIDALCHVLLLLICWVFFFILKQCWILSDAFSASIQMVMWGISSLHSVNVVYDLCMLIHPCIPVIDPTWSWCKILLLCCWIQFANILLRIFALILIWDTGLQFSCSIFIWFWSQGDIGIREWVMKCSLLFNFVEIWEGLVLVLYLFGKIYQWSHQVQNFFFLRFFFFITDLISVLVICLRFSISSWFKVATFCISRNTFYLGYPIFWHTVLHSVLL